MVYMSQPEKNCVQCFTLLADTTRVKIIKALQREKRNVSELTHEMNVTQPTISHHLKQLEIYGLVVKERRGRETFYSFNEEYPCKGCGVFWAPIRI
jgi:DNA-binding transcriptional ArsR family regulator